MQNPVVRSATTVVRTLRRDWRALVAAGARFFSRLHRIQLRLERREASADVRPMAIALRMGRFLGLVLLPLAVLIITVSVRPLVPPEVRTAWPILGGVPTVAAFAFVAITSYGWTRSRITAVFATMAAVGATLVGLYALLLWALSSTWG